MNNITFIKINQIKANPLNPRKDLGDLTELTASIKEKGILQNLTVVPNGEEYTTVIGHRRHEAAKLAGLSEVPCVVKEMTEKEQVQIMLLENIQRNELTPFEQAQGFQMMLDLGSSINDIVQDTGLSESTVRHRLKLNELDRDLLAEKSAETINIQDYIKLEEIKNPEYKNEALKTIGTNEFHYTVEKIKNREHDEETEAEFDKQLETFAKKINDDETADKENIKIYICYEIHSGNAIIEIPEDADEIQYYYTADKYYRRLYKDKVDCEREENANIEETTDPKTDEILKVKEEIRIIHKAMIDSRMQYIINISQAKCKNYNPALVHWAVTIFLNNSDFVDEDIFDACLKIEMPDELQPYSEEYDEAYKEKIQEARDGNEQKMLAVLIYSILENFNVYVYDTADISGKFKQNEHLNILYSFLSDIGYKASEEEKQILNGTHELYIKEEE